MEIADKKMKNAFNNPLMNKLITRTALLVLQVQIMNLSIAQSPNTDTLVKVQNKTLNINGVTHVKINESLVSSLDRKKGHYEITSVTLNGIPFDYSKRVVNKLLYPVFLRHPESRELIQKAKQKRTLYNASGVVFLGGLALSYYGTSNKENQLMMTGAVIAGGSLLVIVRNFGKFNEYLLKAANAFNKAEGTAFRFYPFYTPVVPRSNLKLLQLEYAYQLSLQPPGSKNPFKIKNSIP